MHEIIAILIVFVVLYLISGSSWVAILFAGLTYFISRDKISGGGSDNIRFVIMSKYQLNHPAINQQLIDVIWEDELDKPDRPKLNQNETYKDYIERTPFDDQYIKFYNFNHKMLEKNIRFLLIDSESVTTKEQLLKYLAIPTHKLLVYGDQNLDVLVKQIEHHQPTFNKTNDMIIINTSKILEPNEQAKVLVETYPELKGVGFECLEELLKPENDKQADELFDLIIYQRLNNSRVLILKPEEFIQYAYVFKARSKKLLNLLYAGELYFKIKDKMQSYLDEKIAKLKTTKYDNPNFNYVLGQYNDLYTIFNEQLERFDRICRYNPEAEPYKYLADEYLGADKTKWKVNYTSKIFIPKIRDRYPTNKDIEILIGDWLQYAINIDDRNVKTPQPPSKPLDLSIAIYGWSKNWYGAYNWNIKK